MNITDRKITIFVALFISVLGLGALALFIERDTFVKNRKERRLEKLAYATEQSQSATSTSHKSGWECSFQNYVEKGDLIQINDSPDEFVFNFHGDSGKRFALQGKKTVTNVRHEMRNGASTAQSFEGDVYAREVPPDGQGLVGKKIGTFVVTDIGPKKDPDRQALVSYSGNITWDKGGDANIALYRYP